MPPGMIENLFLAFFCIFAVSFFYFYKIYRQSTAAAVGLGLICGVSGIAVILVLFWID